MEYIQTKNKLSKAAIAYDVIMKVTITNPLPVKKTNSKTDFSQPDPKTSYEEVPQRQTTEEEHDLPPPPDGGYGWVIVAASFICNMVVDGISYTFGIFLPQIVETYGETKGNVAWVGSILTGMTMCAGPLVSALANKYGCRTVCIAGSLVSAAAFAVSIFSPNVVWLMLSYGFLGGIGFGLIYLPAVVCVGYYFESKRSLATGIAVCGSGFGTFVFAPLASFLLETYGWRGANLILAGIILNCVIFGALMRPLEYKGGSKGENLARNPSVLTFDGGKGGLKSASHGAIALSAHDVRVRLDSVGSALGRSIVDVSITLVLFLETPNFSLCIRIHHDLFVFFWLMYSVICYFKW